MPDDTRTFHAVEAPPVDLGALCSYRWQRWHDIDGKQRIGPLHDCNKGHSHDGPHVCGACGDRESDLGAHDG